VIEDPAAQRVAEDLLRQDFLDGVATGRWRFINQAFPIVDLAVRATEPDGTRSEYAFRFELTNFPAEAPMVRIWDADAGAPLAKDDRPKGNARVERAFQSWGDDTVYRPWDRLTGPHSSNATNFPHLAWRGDRSLMFVLEDLYALLNLNARALRRRAAA
jgi:hypothetical protein